MCFGKYAILIFQMFKLLLIQKHMKFFLMVRNCLTALCKINDLQIRAGRLSALHLISNQGCKGKTVR